jgi:hypothetical protein
METEEAKRMTSKQKRRARRKERTRLYIINNNSVGCLFGF